MIKRILIAVVLLALVGGGLVGFNLFKEKMIGEYFATMQQPAVPVDTVTADSGPWTPTLQAIGTVAAARGIELAVETGGTVREVGFAANQRIEEGQVLVRIGDEVEQAQLAAAEAAVTLAQQSLDRVNTLGDRGVASGASVDEAQSNLTSAQAQARQYQAVIDQKVLEAPFSGEIGIPQIEAGEFVAAGTPVATLQDVDTLRVDFSLPEQSRSDIRAGQPVTVRAENGAEATGEIRAIEPRIDPATRLVAIRAELDNSDGQLSPGQFVTVLIELPTEEDVVSLPQTAVITSLYGDYVFRVGEAEDDGEAAPSGDASSGDAAPGGAAEAQGAPPEGQTPAGDGPKLEVTQVFVEVGSLQGSRLQIADGVAVGDVIVVAGQNRLSNGSPVTLSDGNDGDRGDGGEGGGEGGGGSSGGGDGGGGMQGSGGGGGGSDAGQTATAPAQEDPVDPATGAPADGTAPAPTEEASGAGGQPGAASAGQRPAARTASGQSGGGGPDASAGTDGGARLPDATGTDAE